MRAAGGFGCTMTCASHVQRVGQGFAGQLGCWTDAHLEGPSRPRPAVREASHGARCVLSCGAVIDQMAASQG